jgi:hypothetical protein
MIKRTIIDIEIAEQLHIFLVTLVKIVELNEFCESI